MTALGGYAMTAITALTAQNTRGVFGVHPVPPDFIGRQMTLCLDDIGADAVKTGMLHSVPVIETVAETLRTHAPGAPLVCDPVMVAKGGAALLEEQAEAALTALLLPLAAVLTPNLPEAERLLGRTIGHEDAAAEDAADGLLALGPRAVVLKGGHRPGAEMRDLLVWRGDAGVQRRWFAGPKIETPDTHGTGCTLASALACGLAQGMDGEAATARALDYVARAIAAAPGFGGGHGPLGHGWPCHSEVSRP